MISLGGITPLLIGWLATGALIYGAIYLASACMGIPPLIHFVEFEQQHAFGYSVGLLIVWTFNPRLV